MVCRGLSGGGRFHVARAASEGMSVEEDPLGVGGGVPGSGGHRDLGSEWRRRRRRFQGKKNSFFLLREKEVEREGLGFARLEPNKVLES